MTSLPGLHDVELVQVTNRIAGQLSFHRLACVFHKLDTTFLDYKMYVKLVVNQFVPINVNWL